MSGHRLIVLKFGGSVLLSIDRLRLAVHEIYRLRRDGYQVVAVVSALAGETDALIETSAAIDDTVTGHARAALVGLGELKATALLGVQLARAGIPAETSSPAACNMIAEGSPENADPVSIDAGALRRQLDRAGVLVFPGFIALDREGRGVLLGRGGSDLTALFLAAHLNADRCRLLKDVDGLYDRDPTVAPVLGAPIAKRYARCTYDDALATDGMIIQHKAIMFARRSGLVFELGALNSDFSTVIGAAETTLDRPAEARRSPATVALLGLGTVNQGVLDLLDTQRDRCRVTLAAVRDPAKHVGAGIALKSDAVEAAKAGATIVVEAIGGLEPARSAILAALERGSHVVTANKAVIAAHGIELRDAARRFGRRLLCSAAVGGVTPVIEVASSRSGVRVVRVRGVLNGTTNFILNLVASGTPFGAALSQAKALGYAEADPSRDLEGIDAADKLQVLALALGLGELRAESIHREPLTAAALDQLLAARDRPGRLRHIAEVRRASDGNASASVRLALVPESDGLFELPGATNAATIEWEDGFLLTVRGRGAGRWATAESVVGDVLELLRAEVRS
ncbi:MAG: homoserine dehydrogenase [Planctomycetota bacterium]|nr:homoserine dehydrogenase [Planctomycetota bacterium]